MLNAVIEALDGNALVETVRPIVTKALNDGLQAALTGTKTPAQAMKDAQAEADRLLRSYK